MKGNWVAKNMNNYNRPSFVPDKRDKYLDEQVQRERQYEPEIDEEWDDEYYER